MDKRSEAICRCSQETVWRPCWVWETFQRFSHRVSQKPPVHSKFWRPPHVCFLCWGRVKRNNLGIWWLLVKPTSIRGSCCAVSFSTAQLLYSRTHRWSPVVMQVRIGGAMFRIWSRRRGDSWQFSDCPWSWILGRINLGNPRRDIVYISISSIARHSCVFCKYRWCSSIKTYKTVTVDERLPYIDRYHYI